MNSDDKYKQLYNNIKNRIVFREDNNTHCSDLCYYIKLGFTHKCKLFNQTIYNYSTRCTDCVEIFGTKNQEKG